MIKLSPGLNSMSDEVKSECLGTLRCIFPDEFQYVVNDFTLIEESVVVGEAKFKSKFRVNVTDESGIKSFIQSLGDKSGMSYNTERRDVKGKNTECAAKIYFTLSGSSLHTSNRKRMSLTRMQKDQYPLDIE